jgi:hypothetical protein
MTGCNVEEADVIQDAQFVGIGRVGLVAHSTKDDQLVVPWIV